MTLHDVINIRGWYAASGWPEKSFRKGDYIIHYRLIYGRFVYEGKRQIFDPTERRARRPRRFAWVWAYLVRAKNNWDDDVLYVPAKIDHVGETPVMPIPSVVGIPSSGKGIWKLYRSLDGAIVNTMATVIYC